MFWIDCHCHLTDQKIWEKKDLILAEAFKNNIKHFALGGYDYKDWLRQIELKLKYQNSISTCFGLHPWVISKKNELALEAQFLQLEDLIAQADFLGETGLDYYRAVSEEEKSLQIYYFERHIHCAQKYNKTLVMHMVKSYKEAIGILKKSDCNKAFVHSYSGDLHDAKKYLDLGIKLSFSGRHQNILNSKYKEIIQFTPLDMMLIESDSPDAKWNNNDLYNTPNTILKIADHIAQIKNISSESLQEQIFQNFMSLK